MMRSLWQLRQREELAAGRIQRVWRGRQGRKAYEQVKRAMLEKQRKERACVQIQRMYRGHAGRTDAEVKRALRGLETDAAPLLKKIAMDEARLRAAAAELAESDRILGAEKEDEEKLTEELELVKLTKTKYVACICLGMSIVQQADSLYMCCMCIIRCSKVPRFSTYHRPSTAIPYTVFGNETG